MYRENPGMGRYYPAVRTADGGLKLDDRFYLAGVPATSFALVERAPQFAHPDSADFPDTLFREGDYHRAITEYKRRMFFHPQDSGYCLLRIASAYRRSGDYETSMAYAATAFNRADLTERQRHDAHLTLGLGCMAMHLPSLSLYHLQSARALDSSGVSTLCLGWLSAGEGNWSVAQSYFEDVATSHTSDSLGRTALLLSQLAGQGPLLRSKSPGLALALSLGVPGAGQLYAGHGYDALQAFFLTASFAFASYAMYRYENEPGRGLKLTYVSIGITTLFHAANMLSAYRTAQYFNWRKRNDHLARMGELILPHTF
jgi:hypothetical protein